MKNKQESVETGRNVDGLVESDMDVDNEDNNEVKEVADDGNYDVEVDGKDEGESKDEVVGDGEEEEDFVLGCDCGEYELEDWLVMCDGCVHYFHASCIGLVLLDYFNIIIIIY